MFIPTVKRLILLAMFSGLLLACTSSNQTNHYTPPKGQKTQMPMGQALFCTKNQSHRYCKDTQAFLEEVDKKVRKVLTYQRDGKVLGFGDVWTSPRRAIEMGLGDCEEYMMVASYLLEEEGVPEASLWFVGLSLNDTGRLDHAALVVSTGQGLTLVGDVGSYGKALLKDNYTERQIIKWASVRDPKKWFLWKRSDTDG